MKTIRNKGLAVLLALLAVVSAGVRAQGYSEVQSRLGASGITELDTVQAVREIKGGTAIITTFSSDMTLDEQAAFNYACKLIEEKLPTMLPLTISAS